MQLYLSDPRSQLLDVRSASAGENPEEAKIKNVQAVKRMYAWLLADPRRGGSVTFHDSWPGQPVIQCDDELYLGFYFREVSSQCAQWLQVNPDSALGKIALQQFNFQPAEITACLKTVNDFSKWLAQNSPPKAPKGLKTAETKENPHTNNAERIKLGMK